MATHDEGKPNTAYAPTSNPFRKEIKEHVQQHVTTLATLKREANNVISESDTFHYDVRSVENNRYKFEVQYRKGKGQYSQKTVAVVLIDQNAHNTNSLNDFHTALANALKDGHVWRVS